VTDRLIRTTTALAVVAVAVVAAVVSYQHAFELVRLHGESGVTARLVPFTVDGLIWAASMVVLDASSQNQPVPRLAAWCLSAGIVATVGANLAHGVGRGPVGALVSAANRPLAGPGRGHDGLVGFEGPHLPADERQCLTLVTGVDVHLAAARLAARTPGRAAEVRARARAAGATTAPHPRWSPHRRNQARRRPAPRSPTGGRRDGQRPAATPVVGSPESSAVCR
jgi:hypothetical protein